jgi:hypothetical protein
MLAWDEDSTVSKINILANDARKLFGKGELKAYMPKKDFRKLIGDFQGKRSIDDLRNTYQTILNTTKRTDSKTVPPRVRSHIKKWARK